MNSQKQKEQWTMPDEIKCRNASWKIGKPISSGGFGQVFEAEKGDGQKHAIKTVPKAIGGDRDLLFANPENGINIVPIIDTGETDTHWVIVMPLAEKSLRDEIVDRGALPQIDVVEIAQHIAQALESIEGRLVHRDLKPENVLLLDGKWCLSDFGISRYAESSTAPDTQKYALSPPYAAPERWRAERATAAADIYSLGVMLYEMLSGKLPFLGPEKEDFREQHLHHEANDIDNVDVSLQTIIAESLYKAPQSRPTVSNFARRIARINLPRKSEAFSKLQQVNQSVVREQSEQARIQSERQSEAERRSLLLKAAEKTLNKIHQSVSEVIQEAAPAATVIPRTSDLVIKLQGAVLTLTKLQSSDEDWGKYGTPKFDVVAHAEIGIEIPINQYGYEGRSHSLWYCDAQSEGEYKWFETAFMFNPFANQRSQVEPFSLSPGPDAGQAVMPGINSYQLAWTFDEVTPDNMEKFLERWVNWFADAASGDLRSPSRMPEREARDSYRT